MKQPKVRPPSAGVLNTESHELDREPSFGSLTTDELAPPPADISDAPMTPNENGTRAASLDMMSFRTPREIKYRMKVLAATLEVPVQVLCTRAFVKFLADAKSGSDSPPLN